MEAEASPTAGGAAGILATHRTVIAAAFRHSNAAWAEDVAGVSPRADPEPSTGLLVLAGCSVSGIGRRIAA
jgi:hypothetical protein